MNTKGFSLIELMVVIAIIVVLAGVSYGGLLSVNQASKRHTTQLVLDKVDGALRVFKSDMGFYPLGEYAHPPLQVISSGVDKGLIDRDPTNQLPRTSNDDVWAPSGTISTWLNGNGLFSRLGSEMPEDKRNLALANAQIMRDIELDRFYHVGNFGNVSCQGIDTPPGFVVMPPGTVTAMPARDWTYVDPIGPVSLGERELKSIMDHFRVAPGQIARSTSSFDAFLHSSTSSTEFRQYIVQVFQIYIDYMRPRDAADAYMRALRFGVSENPPSYDSRTDGTGAAQGLDMVTKSPTIANPSVPWHGDYLGDQFERRFGKDVDGDGYIDLVDAYGQPLVYICEGLPARQRISTSLAAINRNGLIPQNSPNQYGQVLYGKACMLLYHPDPDEEKVAYIRSGGTNPTSFMFVTDRPNSRGVPVRADAADIALIDGNCRDATGGGGNPVWGSQWIWSMHGINLNDLGDPYWLDGTLIPSRIAVRATPTNVRAGEVYYCLSKDGERLVEPWLDVDGNGEWDSGEPHFDRIRNGYAYDNDVAPVDSRICAPIGENREFELVSPGRDAKYHAWRSHQANVDNLRPQIRRK